MSDTEDSIEKPFQIEIAKQGRAVCKKCKQKCPQGEIRMAKLTSNPFGAGKMKNWHHVGCLFEVFQKQRVTTKRLEDPEEDLEGWNELNDEERKKILDKIDECNKFFESKHGTKILPKKTKNKASSSATSVTSDASTSSNNNNNNNSKLDLASHKDNSFREFRRLVAEITNVNSYLEKTELVRKMFSEGSDGKGFKGDILLWCRLLLPGFVKRIYNLQSKQIIKLFSRIFHADQEEMLEDLEQGDVSETVQTFFDKSKSFKPSKKSALTLQQVDEFLEELSSLTKEDEQINHLKSFSKKCTANDLKVVIRLIKHDLRMNAGAKHILDGVHSGAYLSYQSSRDLEAVLNHCLGDQTGKSIGTISLMTPVLPMLAEACKSVEQAMKKCPNGMYSEIKYDGERVQVHKQGTEFKYFSRSLKPVLPHKVAHFKNYIPQAFPHGKDLILDSEILMIDTNTGKPLPFGTLGKHKKEEFKDATVCLFVFDCIHYNGEILTDKPIKHRKKILRETMTEIPNHIVFSEMEEIHDPKDLSNMIAKVLKLGLEGLVLKDINSVYKPGKRHWLKVKKDYLFGGAMADSADLIVLGAWYGTGKKGGMMSVFLMGCYDESSKKFCTVTKVHTGHDDKTLERLQDELVMDKISCDVAKVPSWLNCTKSMVPDFVAEDPRKQPVWEVTGAEFTQHDVHTADGISIRFPRVTRIRDDKSWDTATSLQELKVLFKNSKESTDVSLLTAGINSGDEVESDNKKRVKKGMKQNSLLNFINVEEKKDSPKRKRLGDDSDSAASSSKKIKQVTNIPNLKNPLPDFFNDVFIILEDGVRKKFSELVRYFVAYGGTVLKSGDDFNAATHVIHLKKVTNDSHQFCCGPSIKHVTVDWLRNCIASEKVLDYKPYIVCLKP